MRTYEREVRVRTIAIYKKDWSNGVANQFIQVSVLADRIVKQIARRGDRQGSR